MAAAPAQALKHVEIRRARISIDFFVIATLSFASGVSAAPWTATALAGYFYQAPVLALVHTFALGWITATIIGVMYRYVPALTHTPLPFPRLLMPQLILYVIGASGMVSHFALGSWSGIWSAALVVIASIALFATNIFPMLWARFARGVAETGIFLALCFLLVAATLGFLLALDKSYGFLDGSVISNLAGHAHLAAVGWVTLTVCAVSYRMLPALTLSRIALPRSAAWQLYALTAGVIGLAITLLVGLPGLALWSATIALALIAYIVTIVRLVWTHRKPIGWSVRHAFAGIAWLMLAIGLGIALSFSGAESELGARLAASYGTAGILGWMGNFIIGISYYLFPGFVARLRSLHRWSTMDAADLSSPRPRGTVFVTYNLALATIMTGQLVANSTICLIGSVAIGAGGLLYSGATLRTLAFAYREGWRA